MANSWFYFTGGNWGQPHEYTITSGNPHCIQPKQRLCAIFAEVQLINGIDRPVITGSLYAEIAAALMTKVESNNVRLKPN